MQECKKCLMKDGEGYTEIKINQDGFCNICTGETKSVASANYKKIIENYLKFENYIVHRTQKDGFDCMLMFSGGKDSIYMLNKLITEIKIRPLAYTFNLPYESKQALKNIEKIVPMLGVEHVQYSPNVKLYNKAMQMAFTYDKEKMKPGIDPSIPYPVKVPCRICSLFIKISAFVFAYRMGIKYILYCADPMQMAESTHEIKNTIESLIKICGKELIYEFFNKEIIDKILEGNEEDMPLIVCPYVAMLSIVREKVNSKLFTDDYNMTTIISELERLGMYDSTPLETHCELYPLLQYYAYKRYNCNFYALQYSTGIRMGFLDKEVIKEYLDGVKDIVFSIAADKHLDEAYRDHIKSIIVKRPSLAKKTDHVWEIEMLLSLKKIAAQVGIDLKSI